MTSTIVVWIEFNVITFIAIRAEAVAANIIAFDYAVLILAPKPVLIVKLPEPLFDIATKYKPLFRALVIVKLDMVFVVPVMLTVAFLKLQVPALIDKFPAENVAEEVALELAISPWKTEQTNIPDDGL